LFVFSTLAHANLTINPQLYITASKAAQRERRKEKEENEERAVHWTSVSGVPPPQLLSSEQRSAVFYDAQVRSITCSRFS
jgi:hypothetical protein